MKFTIQGFASCLLESGVDIHEKDISGATALHVAFKQAMSQLTVSLKIWGGCQGDRLSRDDSVEIWRMKEMD
jgi:ankyrin repeat protein